MSRPVIGIVCTVGPDPSADERDILYVGKPYVDRILEAGGLPILLPHGVDAAQAAQMLDGWMIIGGRDIEPTHFGETAHPEAVPESAARYATEASIFQAAAPGMPVLGICYGCQFLNVQRGGSLAQHLPDTLGHDDHSGGTRQNYEVTAGSLAEGALRTQSPAGKSYHHQAIDSLGKGLKVSARAEDGTIEAVEDESGRWVLGIQWHPERTPELPESQALFLQFVDQARRYQREKATCGTW